MAEQLAIVRKKDRYDTDESSVNLWAFGADVALKLNTWRRGVGRNAPIIARMEFVIEDTTQDAMAARIQAIDEKIEQVVWDRGEITEEHELWLRDQLENETGQRQSYIRDIETNIRDELHRTSSTTVNGYVMAIERMPWWEPKEINDDYDSLALSCAGGQDNYGTVVGDISARIALTKLIGTNDAVEYWWGFRTARFGTKANFVSTWECEDGSLGTNASVDAASEVNTASPGSGSGSFVAVNFVDETLVERIVIQCSDVTANTSDQRGTYMVVLRARNDAAGVCRARLASGYRDTKQKHDRVVIDSQSWLCYSMGTVSIPSFKGAKNISGQLDGCYGFELAIEAELISGTPELRLDCLYLVPIAEGGGYAKAESDQIHITVSPDMATNDAWAFDILGITPSPVSAAEASLQNYGLPVGAGDVVLVAQRATQHVLGDVADVAFVVYERWKTLRGAE